MKHFAMYTFVHKGKKKPSISSLARKFNVKPDDFDSEFGIVEVDPETKTYCFMLDLDAAKNIINKDKLSGPFSDPQIEPL